MSHDLWYTYWGQVIPSSADAFSYQWMIVDDEGRFRRIAGATGPAYSVKQADLKRDIRVRVGFTDEGGYAEAPIGRPTEAWPGIRITGKEFSTLSAAGNNDPRGIWSDGATMWVLDSDDDRILRLRYADEGTGIQRFRHEH